MKIKLLVIVLSISTMSAFGQTINDSIYANKVYDLFVKANQYIYFNQDSAYYYYDRINKLAIDKNDFQTLIESISASNKGAAHFYNLEKMKANFLQLDSIVAKNKKSLKQSENELFYTNSILMDRGIYHYLLNDYEKSRQAYLSIIRSTEALKDSELNAYHIDLLTSAYSFVAKMYFNDGKYDLAKEFYLKNIRVLESKQANDIRKTNRTYSLLAEVLKSQKHYGLSNQYFKKSLDYNLHNEGRASSIVTEANHLLENHLSIQQIDSANYYLNIIKQNLPENYPIWNVFHEAKANILKAENKYSEAEKELQTALRLLNEKWNSQPNNEIAEAYYTIGLLHNKFKNPAIALENFNLALEQFAAINNRSAINQTTVLKILKDKARALNTMGKFRETLKTVRQGTMTLDQIKPTFKNNSDKLFLMDEAFPLFDTALEATYRLYQKTQQDSLIDQAFYHSEKSKSVLLLDALLSTKATEFANIPKKVVEKEQELKARITYLEKQLNDTPSTTLESELFDTKNSYRQLIATIETEYKTYYDLKYNAEVVSLAELQQFLKPNSALISYFYGNDAIYSIIITKDSKNMHRIKRDHVLDETIISVYNMLNTPKSDLKELNTKSFQLYTALLAPNLKNLKEKHLLILADGLLNYLPFSSLSSNGSAQYVVENYAVSYVNSATLLNQLSEKEAINNKVLAFAPSFDGKDPNHLLPLPNNKNEVKDILNFFNGKTLTDQQATLQNFNKEGTDYGVLHFATHAILDDDSPEYSYLAFQPDTANNLLYVSDLYNMKLNTSLVTLSACESGIGSLNRGEGFMSLARGFYFSGASSITSTLWKINDASATRLMDGFYKNLSRGDTKDVALQKAQFDFLNSNSQNALSHPYYWSAFVVSGHTDAIVTNQYWIWLVLGGLVVLGGLLLFRRKSSV